MESVLSSDDSCDSEMKLMKNQLSEFGFDEDNLSKEEMSDLLKALRNSKENENEVKLSKQKDDENSCNKSPAKTLKRRHVDVNDRRMPWSLFPSTLTQAEKARTLAVYIKLMSINNYRQARQSSNFASWPPPIQIVEETTRVQPIRSTRSGRSVPVYVGLDDDSSDIDFVITKSKKRKVSNSDSNDVIYTNKVVSLKRKSKDENIRPMKEAKMNSELKIESVTPGNILKTKKDIFTLIED